jgi:hypothetical protein
MKTIKCGKQVDKVKGGKVENDRKGRIFIPPHNLEYVAFQRFPTPFEMFLYHFSSLYDAEPSVMEQMDLDHQMSPLRIDSSMMMDGIDLEIDHEPVHIDRYSVASL